MNDMVLRDAAPGEHARIREVTLAAYGQYAAALPDLWDLYRQSIIGTLAGLAGAAQGSPRAAEQIVALRDGAIIGCVLLYPVGAQLGAPGAGGVPLAWPEMRLLAVDPAARGAGAGAALVRECIRRARESGATAITLHTLEFMRVAKAMYERMGFVRAPELDVHPVPEFTAIGYRLEL